MPLDRSRKFIEASKGRLQGIRPKSGNTCLAGTHACVSEMREPSKTHSTDSVRLSAAWSSLTVVLLAVATWVAFGGSVENGFIYDDCVIVRDNPRLTSLDGIPEIFTTEYWNRPDLPSRLYRPVTLLGFALDRALWGPEAGGSHVVNVALHAAVAVLFWWLGVRLLLRAGLSPRAAGWGAGAAGVLFAVHPIHSEVVLGLVGRAELLVAFFGLAVLHLVVGMLDGAAGWWRKASLSPLVFLAAGSKESAVLLLPVVAAGLLVLPKAPVVSGAGGAATPYRLGQRLRTLLEVLLWSLPGLIVYGALRTQALRGIDAPPVYFTDNPLVAVAPFDRLGTAFAIVWRYVSLHFWPAGLSPDYSYNSIPLQSLGHPEPILGLLTLLLLGMGIVWGVRTSRRPVEPARAWAFGLAWFAMGLVALSNLLVLLSTVFGERLIYFPGIGLFLVWAVLLAWAIDGARKPVPGDVVAADKARSGAAAGAVVLSALSALGIAAFVAGSRSQTEIWSSNATLFSYAVDAQPESFRVWDAHGRSLMETGDLEAAEAALRRSTTIWPQFDRTQSSLLSIYLDTGQADSALVTANRLLALDPTNEKACYAKAQHAMEMGDASAAFSWVQQGLASSPDYAPLHFILGQVHESRGEWAEALRSYEVMLRAQPAMTNLKVRMAALLVQAERWDEAVERYRELTTLVQDWSVDNGLAWSLLQRGRTDVERDDDHGPDLREALQAAERAVAAAPAEMKRYPRDTRAEILWDSGRHEEARAAFRALAEEFPAEPDFLEKAHRPKVSN